jgi:hypothetical protein
MFLSHMRKFRMEQLPWNKESNILLTASSYCISGNIFAFPHILGSPSSYMTLQLLHSKFSYIEGKFYFIFYQCMHQIFRFNAKQPTSQSRKYKSDLSCRPPFNSLWSGDLRACLQSYRLDIKDSTVYSLFTITLIQEKPRGYHLKET